MLQRSHLRVWKTQAQETVARKDRPSIVTAPFATTTTGFFACKIPVFGSFVSSAGMAWHAWAYKRISAYANRCAAYLSMCCMMPTRPALRPLAIMHTLPISNLMVSIGLPVSRSTLMVSLTWD